MGSTRLAGTRYTQLFHICTHRLVAPPTATDEEDRFIRRIKKTPRLMLTCFHLWPPHLHIHPCSLQTPQSLSLDRIASGLVPMATAQRHQVAGEACGLQCGSPYRGSRPALCGSKRPDRLRPLVGRTPPPRVPCNPEWSHSENPF